MVTVLALTFQMTVGVITGELFVEPKTVGPFTLADYTFEINLSEQVPAGGSLRLQFSFDLVTFSNEYTCEATYGLSGTPICPHSGRDVGVTNAFPSTDYLVIVTLKDVINPFYVSSFFVGVSSYDADKNLVETSGSTAFKVTTEPGSMSTVLTNLGSDVVGELTDIQIETTPDNQVSSDGYIMLETPKWNYGTQTLGLQRSMFTYTAADYDPVEQGYRVECNSPTHPNAKCTFFVETPTSASEIATTFDKLKISLGDTLAPQTSVRILTEGSRFKNPPSTRPVKLFQAKTFNDLNLLVDSQTQNIEYQVTTGATLTASSVTITSVLGEINIEDQFDFTIHMPLPLPVGAIIQMKIPSDISIWSDNAQTQRILNGAAGFSPIYTVPQVQILDSATQEVQITSLVPSQKYYVDSDNYIKFSLLDLKNPQSLQASGEFELSIYEQDYIILDVDSTDLVYTASPGRFDSISVLPESYRTRDQVNYRFQFVTRNDLVENGQISIKIPEQLAFDFQALVFEPKETVSVWYSPSWDEESRTLLIQNAFDRLIESPVMVKFDISVGLSNSWSTDAIDPFIIATLDENGKIIDQGESEQLTYSPNEIFDIQTEACAEKQTASMTHDICTYKLKFIVGAQYPILSGSKIEVELPDDLIVADTTLTRLNSYTEGIADLDSTFKVGGSQRRVTISNCFLQDSSPNGEDWRQDSFAVYIAGVMSPRSTAPTLSFKAYIKSAEGFLEYQKVQGVFSNVYQAKEFSKAIIKPTNEVNGEDSGVYNFTIEFSSTVYKNEYFKITPPAQLEIGPGGAHQCSGIRGLSENLSCTLKGDSLYVMIVPSDVQVEQFDAGTVVQFQVKDIKNPLSLAPSESFKIYVTESLYQDWYVNQMVSGLSILNEFEGAMLNVQVLPDSNQLGKVTDYAIYFTPTNEIPQGSYVEVEFPAAYYDNLDSVTCIGIKNTGISTRCSSPSPNIITVTQAFETRPIVEGEEIGFKLKNIKNPLSSIDQETIASEFKIRTVSPEGYPIDLGENLDFTIGCIYPCLSCDTEQTSCTSCQMVSSLRSLFLYSSMCFEECPPGFYADLSNTCQSCSYPCERCDTDSAFCDSCLESSGLPLVDDRTGQCYQTCPEGTFKSLSSRSCEECVGSCATCVSQNECLSCSADSYFLEGQCLESCPNTSILFDSEETKACQKCAAPCYTCEGTVDQCTSCLDGNYLHEGECIDACPRTYLPDAQNTCYAASETTLPFITFSVPLALIIMIAISECRDRKTKKYTAFIALQSAWLICFWLYMMLFLIKDGHAASTMLLVFAFVCNIIINCIWYEFYKEKIISSDVLYLKYTMTYPKTQKTILVFSLITSFQLFRLQYAFLFKAENLHTRMMHRAKYYKRMNRYTLFQITFVYVPTFSASIYNLFFTWYGRQIFWIDVENIVITVLMMVAHTIIIFRTEKEYLSKMSVNNPKKTSRKERYRIDEDAQVIADEIEELGMDQTQQKIRKLPKNKRVGVWQALVNKIFGREKNVQELAADHQFKLKHGRGLESFPQEEEGPAEIKERLGYGSEMIPKTKTRKLMLGDAGLGDYAQMEQTQDVTQTLGATQTLEITEDDLPIEGDKGYQGLNEHDITGRIQETDVMQQTLEETGMPHLQRDLTNVSIAEMQEDPELFNFASAPMNAESAIHGNPALEQRFREFQDELMERLRNKRIGAGLRRNLNRGGIVQPDDGEMISNYLSKKFSNLDDSDDREVNFDSAQWGAGTTKVVADHYNTCQNQRSGSDSASQSQQKLRSKQPLTQQDFQIIHEDIILLQDAKKDAKLKSKDFDQKIVEDEVQLSAEKDDTTKMKEIVRQLQAQIDAHMASLNRVQEGKKNELEFVENANYTSNEDGMGINPATFDAQNQMPRKGLGFRKSVKNSSGKGRRRNNSSDLDALESELLPNRRVVEKPKILHRTKNSHKGSSTSSRKSAAGRSADMARTMGSNMYPRGPTQLETVSERRAGSTKPSLRPKPGKKNGGITFSSGSNQTGTGKNKLKTGHLYDQEDDYEYYTSHDEHGNVVQKLRKKKKGNRKPRGPKQSQKKQLKSDHLLKDDDMEYYTSKDEKGRPVQKLRKKKLAGQRANSQGLTGSKKKSRNQVPNVTSSLPIYQAERKKWEKAHAAPQVEYEIYESQDEDGQLVQKTRKKQFAAGINNLNDQRDDQAPLDANQQTPLGGLQNANQRRSRTLMSGSQLTGRQGHSPLVGRNVGSQGVYFPQEMTNQARNNTLLKSGMQQLDTHGSFISSNEQHLGQQTAKALSKKKRQTQPPKDYSGAYFKLTNFERAVIATNGRAPYNNKEVEVITKREGFDPNNFSFKNNWVNNMLKSGHKFEGDVTSRANLQSQNQSRMDMSPKNRHQRLHTASMTATTLFQGLNPASSQMDNSDHRSPMAHAPNLGLNDSQLGTGLVRPNTGASLNQFLQHNQSPMTLGTELKDRTAGEAQYAESIAGDSQLATDPSGTHHQEVMRDASNIQMNPTADRDMPSTNYFGEGLQK